MRVLWVRIVTNPKRPRGKSTEVQAVEFRQLEEHDWVGLLDQAALDLRKVGIGPADPTFDLAERELAMKSCVAQDATDGRTALPSGEIWLSWGLRGD